MSIPTYLYLKILAVEFVGTEYAIGVTATRSLAHLVASEVAKLYDIDGFESMARALVEKTPFRFEIYRPRGKLFFDVEGKKVFFIIGRECPIRQIYSIEGLNPCSMCRVVQRLIEIGFEKSFEGSFRAELVRYGPNACLVKMEFRDTQVPEDLSYTAPPISREEYVEKLKSFVQTVTRCVDRAIVKALGNPAMFYMCGKKYGEIEGMRIVAEVDELVDLGRAVELFNEKLGFLATIRRVDSTYIVEPRTIEGLSSVERFIQGFVAGVLSTLTGRKIEVMKKEKLEVKVFGS